jgi:hypothetical protein
MHYWRYAIGSCSSPGELHLIKLLCPVALNFGKDLDVSSKIKNGSCAAVSITTLFLLEYAVSESTCSLLTEGTSEVGIAVSLFRKEVFAILYFDSTTYFKHG